MSKYKEANTYLDGKPCYPLELVSEGMVGLYVLFEPSGKARYVGVTANYRSRYFSHLYAAKNRSNHRDKWINSVLISGEFPVMAPIGEYTRTEALRQEVSFIANLREVGWPLVNGTEGGDGCFGLHFSEEARRSISASLRKPVSIPKGPATDSIHYLANAGEANHQSKLTKTDVLKMRELMSSGVTNIEVSRMFGVSAAQTSRIRRHESWKWS